MRRLSWLVCIATDTVTRQWCGTVHWRMLVAGRSTLEESYRRATTQGPILERKFTRISRLASQKDRFLTAKQNGLLYQRHCSETPGKPADYLFSGTVGQCLLSPCNGGP